MKVEKYVLILLLAIVTTPSFSQDILVSDVQWNSIMTFNAQDGMISDETTKVVSTPTSITWYSAEGLVIYNLSIEGVDGSWTDVSQEGTIAFNVKDSNKIGVVEFSRKESEVKILIHFMLEDGKSIYELKINSVNSI